MEVIEYNRYEPLTPFEGKIHPTTGCQFCREPDGEMKKYEIYNSPYLYFSCSNEWCIRDATDLVSYTNCMVDEFITAILPNIAIKSGNQLPVLNIGGAEYPIKTGERVIERVKTRFMSDMKQSLPQVIANNWLPSELWERIFNQTRDLIEEDSGLDLKVRFEPNEPYEGHNRAPAVSSDNFLVSLKAYSPEGERVMIHDVSGLDISRDFTTLINGDMCEVHECGGRQLAIERF
jgi:hypothetical protein